MDKIIYEYLIKSNLNEDEKNQVFLDSLLILSINKININYNNLIEYCNTINNNHISSSGNNDNNDIIVNKKRINKPHNYDDDDNIDIYYGLNEKQFQTLFKILKELNHKDDINSENQVYTSHTPALGLNSKFDCSIIIIIQNNLKQQQSQQQPQLNKHPLKKIKLNYSNSQKQQQQQQQQQQDKSYKQIGDYNYVLFKKVWNNIVIRNEIKFHLKLFNVHLKYKPIIFFEEFYIYKYKSYLKSIGLLYDDVAFTSEHSKLIPSSLDELDITCTSFEDNSIPTTIKKLVLYHTFNQKLTKNLYHNNGNGDNITALIFGRDFNQSLSVRDNNDEQQLPWLPRNLTSLEFGQSFQQTIYPGELPNSLTSLIFDKDFKGIIIPNSIPLSVTTLDYIFESNFNQKELNLNCIPSSTTNLKFDDTFDQDIHVGYIPQNVTSLTFGFKFKSGIASGSLPQSLRSIEFGKSFDNSIAHDLLPSNLTSLSFVGNQSFSQVFTIIPNSVTYLKFNRGLNQTIGVETFKKLKNLKTLIYSPNCSDPFVPIESNSLPNTITTLVLSEYRGPLDGNRLPTSLTSLSLTLHSLNFTITPNPLPQSITTLHLHCYYDKYQLPNSFAPPNLKSIYFHFDYKHDLSLIDWPESLESIYIPFNSPFYSNIINSIPTHIFKKYVKFFE